MTMSDLDKKLDSLVEEYFHSEIELDSEWKIELDKAIKSHKKQIENLTPYSKEWCRRNLDYEIPEEERVKKFHVASSKKQQAKKSKKIDKKSVEKIKEYRIERIKEYRKEYYKKNKDRLNKLVNDWRVKNREKFNELIRKRYLKKKKLIHAFTYEQWVSMKNATNGICPSCNTFVGTEKLTLDHIFPISKAEEGRIYTINDIQPLCKSCNSKKHDKIGEKYE